MIFTPITLNDIPLVLEIRNHISTRKFLGNNKTFTLEEGKH